ISIIDFNSETNAQKKKHYAEKTTAITTLFRGEGERVGTNKVRDVQNHSRKSKYVGARNEGDEQSQTREYDRSNLFEAQSPNINGPRIGDSGGIESQNFQFCTKLSNSLLLFSKFMKKGNIKGCCDKKRGTFNISFNPPFRQYDVIRSPLYISVFS